MLRRHRLAIMGTVVVVMCAAVLILTQIQKMYTASSLVVVDRRNAQMLGFETAADGYSGGEEVETEVEIAQSSQVLRRAATALDLANSADFQHRPSILDMARSMFGFGPAEVPASAVRKTFESLSPEDQARIVDSLSRMIDVRRRGLTNVISFSATRTSPEAAAATANAVAAAYLEEQIEARLDSNGRAAAFLKDRIDALSRDITDGETQIDAFINSKLAELGSPEAKNLLVLLGEEAKRRDARSGTLTDLQSAYRAQNLVRLAELVPDSGGDLAARRKALVDRLSGLDDQAQIAAARGQLDALDLQIKAAAEHQVGALQDEIAASNTRSADLRRKIDSMLSDLLLPKEVSTELFRLQRDVETRRTSYDSTLAKLRQVEQQTNFSLPDSRVIASAVPLGTPSWPPTKLILGGSFFLSLCLGLGIAFLRENYVGGINSTEQFEAVAEIPVVAAVSRFNPRNSDVRADQAIFRQPLSSFSEGIRRLSLGVDAIAPKTKRCVFVTSAVPGDGKTTIALVLARKMAMSGVSTLLIDADLRHPSLHRFLGVKADDGLADLLAGSRAAEQLGIVKEPETNLHMILGSAASAVATDALLMSPAFDDLMALARANYDAIIIDTPPIGLVVDATIIARHADVGIFVVRQASTGQRDVRAALGYLRRTGVPLVGVLNCIDDDTRFGAYAKYYSSGPG
ncbi:MAG: polysaccharide biosynthesis tyrosine autokinase [Rhizobiales bacterium]|nr:polysaccharide biosynthesis tyrosine autokinase [Hyphomicrobiales bacterium]